MIIKLQQSLFDSDGIKSCMIYDEKKKYEYITDSPDEVNDLLKLLKDRPKAYFEVQVVDTKIHIIKEVPAKDW